MSRYLISRQKNNMKILKATVVVQSGHGDNVSLTTDLPSPYMCDEGTGVPLYLNFQCAKNQGADYVRKHFGIESDIVKVS